MNKWQCNLAHVVLTVSDSTLSISIHSLWLWIIIVPIRGQLNSKTLTTDLPGNQITSHCARVAKQLCFTIYIADCLNYKGFLFTLGLHLGIQQTRLTRVTYKSKNNEGGNNLRSDTKFQLLGIPFRERGRGFFYLVTLCKKIV